MEGALTWVDLLYSVLASEVKTVWRIAEVCPPTSPARWPDGMPEILRSAPLQRIQC